MPETGTAVETLRAVDRDVRRDFSRVRRFFPAGDPRDVTVALPDVAGTLQPYLSDETIAGIRQHNEECSCGDVTLGHIGMLDHQDVNVVLATHEPSLLTGPLRVIYKALTCIQLAAYCRETLGLRTVPVFWLASGAAQSRRAREVRVINAADQVIALDYAPSGLPAHTRLGDVPLDEQVDFQLRLLERDTANSDYKRYLIHLLLNTRERSATLGEWTARLLHALFHIYGLVVIDECRPYATAQAVRCLTQPFAWGGRPARAMGEAAAELAALQYGGLVTPPAAAAPFTLRDEDGIEEWTEGEEVFTSSRGRTLSPDALREEAARRRADLQVADWLRPLVQASWLPVAAVVAGGADVRLFAHLSGLYEAARVPMPLVYPCARVALVEPHIARLLDKYDIALADFAQQRKPLTDQALAKHVPRPIIAACDRKLDVMQAVLDSLREDLMQSNPEFTGELDQIKRDLGLGLEELRRQLVEAKTESPYVVSANLERARAHLFPEGRPQERVLNVFPFLFTHGIQLISRLATEIDLFSPDVQVLRL